MESEVSVSGSNFLRAQIIDCDYILHNKKPVVRIFCKTETGENVCIFYNKFLPYFYLHLSEDGIEEAKMELEEKFDVKCVLVERTLPIGYQEPTKVLKIIGRDPSKTPIVRDFSRQFGTPYEADVLFKYRFLSDHDLKGMGWLEVTGKNVFTRTVKCRGFEADTIKSIEREKNMPLRYMSVDIECLMNRERMATPEEDKIISIAIRFDKEHRGKNSLIIMARNNVPKGVIGCSSEKEMLEKFVDVLFDYDPDIILGYNINNFDLPYIVRRIEINHVQRDIGRCEKPAYCKRFRNSTIPFVTGRVIVDPFEIIRKDPWLKFKRYDLNTVSKNLLGEGKLDVHGPEEINALWAGSREDLKKLADYNLKDAELALNLVIKRGLVDKFFELSKLSGLLLQDSFGGQAQRHDCRLLNEFFHRKYLLPCRPSDAEYNKRRVEREESGLKGALVLEPEVGLHTNGVTIVLDFTSLYPSIIDIFNICPTTLLLSDSDVEHVTSPVNAKFVTKKVREGVLPSVVNNLVSTRANVKKKIKLEKDESERKNLNAKQLALKDMANSLYGYTGYVRSKLYVMSIANTITGYGRENILRTKKLIEDKYPVRVVYGDTDSVFVKTNITDLDKAMKFGEDISQFVTDNLSGLHLKFEKIFKTFLILTKKRYVGWSFEKAGEVWKDKLVMKGIETVRRDWCQLTTDTMVDVINILMKEEDLVKASKHVRSVLKELTDGKVEIEKLSVVKGISKTLDAYDGIQPHVEVAKKIMKRDPTRQSFVGQRLEYVIVKGNQLLSKRAEELAYVKEKGLEIDSKYYVENQLMPPLERIFEACGLQKSELLEGCRQKSLMDILEKEKKTSPEKTVLERYESVVCGKCDWSFRRPTLNGSCPKCSGEIFFSDGASMGKTVRL